MSAHAIKDDRVLTLAAAVCDETASQGELMELDTALRADEGARKRYLKFCRLHVSLEIEMHAYLAFQTMQGRNDLDSAVLAPWESDVLAAATLPAIPLVRSARAFVPASLHSTLDYFTSGWPMAYLAAMVMMVAGLWVLSHTYISPSIQVAIQLPMDAKQHGMPFTRPEPRIVGRITSMVDCKWNNTDTTPTYKASVLLGQKYTLVSGLMEITYDTGATVILQGPVTYQVEASNGGFISFGKLTGKVTAETARGLTIRTPTAIVTDLGTEFGVEVSKEGKTTSHVFRGSVELRTATTDKHAKSIVRVLHANESACVENGGNSEDSNRTIVFLPSDVSVNFVRKIPEKTIRMFDLVDVVAGGDGFSGKRGTGIDPTNGRRSDVVEFKNPRLFPTGDGKYHRVDKLPFVDGVFIPDGSRGPVQVDSAGHLFADCPITQNRTALVIWAGGVIPTNLASIQTTLDGINYASQGHGLLLLDANKGITFDLNAIRRANPGWTIKRFVSVAGNPEGSMKPNDPVTRGAGSADFWVLVDGKLQFWRREINSCSGIAAISVPIKSEDRFLTLVSTDGGNGIDWDCITFGDPRLELIPQPPPLKSTTKGGP